MLPQEIQEKLSHFEEEYFKKHSGSLKTYMSRIDLDLAVVSTACAYSPHKLSFIIKFALFSLEGCCFREHVNIKLKIVTFLNILNYEAS